MVFLDWSSITILFLSIPLSKRKFFIATASVISSPAPFPPETIIYFP